MQEISVTHNFQGYFSRTFQDLKLQFPGLSRTKVIFQDFPSPGILKKKIQDFPGFSRRRGNPVCRKSAPTILNSSEVSITRSNLVKLAG